LQKAAQKHPSLPQTSRHNQGLAVPGTGQGLCLKADPWDPGTVDGSEIRRLAPVEVGSLSHLHGFLYIQKVVQDF